MYGKNAQLPRSLVQSIAIVEKNKNILGINCTWSHQSGKPFSKFHGSFSINCTTCDVQMHYSELASGKITNQLNNGLIEYLHGPDQWGEMRADYQSAKYTDGSSRFTMGCSWRKGDEKYRSCIIRGSLPPRFEMHFVIQGTVILNLNKNWREIERIYTNIITVEE